jgi:ABC-type antimicrobial peptide transport system permease subunit
MMTFAPIKGDPTAALERNSVVLSKSMSQKLFGDADPIGKTIVFGGGNSLSVGAIVEDIPETNSLKFQMAVPFKVFEKGNDWLLKWDDNRIQTWVELSSEEALAQFNSDVSSLIHKKTNDPNETVFAYPMTRLHLYGGFSNGQPSGGLITIIWILIGFGIFMLLIACVNFMNIATAQSFHRAKEVGVRKVLGAARRWIIFQFLNEALVITFFALVTAVGLCVLVIPSFNTMMHTSISLEFGKSIVWVLCVSVALITALIAGSYPAFVLSRFAPVRVLKGVIDHPGGLSIRRFLVTFQFVISISVLVGTIVLYSQFDYVKKRPLGYELENLVNISLDSLTSAKFAVVKNEVSKVPGVRSVTGTGGNILYSNGSITGMDWPGKKAGEELSIAIAEAEYDWSKTMGIRIVAGRDFDDKIKSDENACLLNQTAVDKMGLVNPVGSVVGGHTVIGVFNDFVYNNPSGIIAPMTVYLAPKNIHHLYARIDNNETWMETIGSIEKTIKQISPDIQFDFRFTADEHQANFEELSDVGLMVSIFGGMTIFISCLGLFGLSGFVAERRGKEMSIRKVFGADSIRVLVSLSADILKPVVIALLIVIPLSVWIANLALEQFVYRVSLTWWMFATATTVVLGIALLVVLYHGWRAAIESPSARLKSE